jgi:hypothetical protein
VALEIIDGASAFVANPRSLEVKQAYEGRE